ncbi:hypothetical protein EKN06_00440 [Croceicoccus ponticola]|uniref:Uncharacterized protein n=1 Tax=Croceicoccus ponticola TaxID=2217664 RepID=A0A437GZE7_9SPHN|nr:hypothetical protein [Croceicoccus ponticola]RVQ68737.1 hypothetical protein EKN06_00440 [Croceicoccus ponticola]
MPIDEAKRRKRWLRNKRAERARKKGDPTPISPMFRRRVMWARDRRAKLAPAGAWTWKIDTVYLTDEKFKRAVELVADVWAAETLYDAQWGKGTATVAQICRMLNEMDRTHGYSAASLPKMVAQARKRVIALETHGDRWSPDQPYWPPFV